MVPMEMMEVPLLIENSIMLVFHQTAFFQFNDKKMCVCVRAISFEPIVTGDSGANTTHEQKKRKKLMEKNMKSR